MAYMVCPDCGKRLPENVNRCHACGKQILDTQKTKLKKQYDRGRFGGMIGACIMGALPLPIVGGTPAALLVIPIFWVWGYYIGKGLGQGSVKL